jgi:diadenosine tetraphosphate (Ap4A) HIT family hydrolase
MKNNSINLGFTSEQWQNHMRQAFQLSEKASSELSSALKENMTSLIQSIFSPDSAVIMNLKSTGGTNEVHSHG